MLHVLNVLDLAGQTDLHSIARKLQEVVDQQPILSLGLLSNVPSRNVQEVDGFLGQDDSGHLDDVRDLHAETLCAHPKTQNEVLSGDFSDAGDDLAEEPHSSRPSLGGEFVVGAGSVLVRALVVLGRHEGADDVSVSTVELDAVEACFLRPNGALNEVVPELFHLSRGERSGLSLLIFRRRDRLLASNQFFRSSHAGMMKLHDGDAVVFLDLRGQAGETGNVVVRPATELSREALADGLHVRSASHRGPMATLRTLREP
mmetsp:Transcript_5131/g.12238  ORF Transcript_5131/g.12238 Transcript_5131/m.12238 type:complete len:259 (+) Transcript_5131:427-1203(+)